MDDDTLVAKLCSLVIGEKKLVTVKYACSLLDVTCKRSKVLLKMLLDTTPQLEATWLISGVERDSTKLKYQVATADKLELTRSRFSKVTEEHVYSLRVKPEEEKQWKCAQDISEELYKADLYVVQNLWLDRENFMSDQILLDHRYSAIPGLRIERTNVVRAHNLCSPDRKKRTKKTDLGVGKPFPKKPTWKRRSAATDLPQKKKAKVNPITSMFGKRKAKKETKRPSLEKEKPTAGATKKGLFGFFSATTKKSNPFDAFKKEKNNPSRPKQRKTTKGRKASTKRKAVKKKTRYKTKPKRPLPGKKVSLDVFADDAVEDNKAWQRTQLEQDEEDEREKYRRLEREFEKRNAGSKGVGIPSSPGQASEDELLKGSRKERRALYRAKEEKRKKDKIASRKVNFFGKGKSTGNQKKTNAWF